MIDHDQFLDRVRPYFADLPGELKFQAAFADGHEVRFISEPFDCQGVVVLDSHQLDAPGYLENKQVEVEGLAGALRESMLLGQYPLRAGYPRPEAV
jgi:hypothetical protein